jgi:hypothetical protein
MPKPRPMGTVAKVVMESMESALAENNDEFFQIATLIQRGDAQEAMETLKEMARKNNMALRAMTFMRADKMQEAEDVVMSAKLKRR